MTDNFDAIKDFLTPKEILVEEIDVNHSKIILEPLERGFGHTLGNALRRIILSSTPGAAVVEAKIDGVLHDYSTIDGIKEDVINMSNEMIQSVLFPFIPVNAQKFADSISKFVDQGGKLTFSINPQNPLPIISSMGLLVMPDLAIESLGIKLLAE